MLAAGAADLNTGYAQLLVANAGEVSIRPSIAMQTVAVNVIWPID
jgi:hypothetical protein